MIKDETLRDELRRQQRRADGAAPDFAPLFAAAEVQAVARKQPKYAGLVAVAAIVALAIWLAPLDDDELTPVTITYVDIEEFAATTSWSAPSDSLLPTHKFDIYRELPRLFESTKPGGGTLL